MHDELPSYDQLPVREGAPLGSAWGLFGDGDQIGCLNLLTPDCVREAAGLVKRGSVFALGLPITLPCPALFGREVIRHEILVSGGGLVRDDRIDRLWPQASSQWDGFRHVRHPTDGFYNGVKDEEIGQDEGSHLGIDHWARRGIAGRGVLLDVARYLDEAGSPLDPCKSTVIDREDLTSCAESQGVDLHLGDILLVRTGWLQWYLEKATPDMRQELGGDEGVRKLVSPGLGPADEMAEYLWDLHVAAVAADNPALEPWPLAGGFLHFRLLPHFGLPIGELWYLEDLAVDCAADGVYEFLLTSAPLNVPGGVASPPNALAIK